ncbi:MAG: (S)-ureidoglycine aminohydrolase, partial [Pseudomonadota bacterium]
VLTPGGFVYAPPGADWAVWNRSSERAVFHWIRKAYDPAPGVPAPRAIITSDSAVPPTLMPGTDAWSTTRFMETDDLSHDMHITIVTLQAGGSIPFAETHIMEHGLYVLEGKGVYRLNGDWVEVEAGDFMWLRAFCPQACVAAGPGPFRYLLYTDVNRHPKLRLP